MAKGLGGGGGWEEKFFPQTCSRSDGESKREQTRECSFIRTLPYGDENDWLLKERSGWPHSDYQLCKKHYALTVVLVDLELHLYRIYYVNIDLRHQYGVSVAEAQTSLPSGKKRGETAVFAG